MNLSTHLNNLREYESVRYEKRYLVFRIHRRKNKNIIYRILKWVKNKLL